ncbi:hypothetical protein [Aeoliella sp.]|uniref:hypothetical protein n=1 Tax=Aeoliella sp. TaxID=2795800 RepID=UPI003CCBC0D0
MYLNDDYKDMLSALSDAEAEYMIVGAYALAAYGNPRATGDIDIWVRPTPDNAKRVWNAIVAFGAPRRMLKESDFALPDTVYQIGVPPNRIDIITSISGVEFETAWEHRRKSDFDGCDVNVIGREHLIENKESAGRPKDIADAHWLKEQGCD